jgi:hypothetical protein
MIDIIKNPQSLFPKLKYLLSMALTGLGTITDAILDRLIGSSDTIKLHGEYIKEGV